MPTNTIVRHCSLLIDSILHNNMRPYPTMQDFVDACGERLRVQTTLNTLVKDMNQMKLSVQDGFEAPILYDRYHRGAFAILFQPFFKITLGRTLWNIVDVVVGLGLLGYGSARKG